LKEIQLDSKSAQTSGSKNLSIQELNDAGDLDIRMDSGREVAFNIRNIHISTMDTPSPATAAKAKLLTVCSSMLTPKKASFW